MMLQTLHLFYHFLQAFNEQTAKAQKPLRRLIASIHVTSSS